MYRMLDVTSTVARHMAIMSLHIITRDKLGQWPMKHAIFLAKFRVKHLRITFHS